LLKVALAAGGLSLSIWFSMASTRVFSVELFFVDLVVVDAGGWLAHGRLLKLRRPVYLHSAL